MCECAAVCMVCLCACARVCVCAFKCPCVRIPCASRSWRTARDVRAYVCVRRWWYVI